MTVKLSPETIQRIERLVESGQFLDADQAVTAALSMLERDDPAYWEQLEALDAEADEDVEHGRLTRVDDAFMQKLRERVETPPPATRRG